MNTLVDKLIAENEKKSESYANALAASVGSLSAIIYSLEIAIDFAEKSDCEQSAKDSIVHDAALQMIASIKDSAGGV